ncbi:MAG: CvpA family protein [Bacteroidales bacterium]|nr:CvpA family protein [Bacteroidales bacterium]
MSVFDIIVIAVFLFFVIKGAISGVFKQLGLIAGVVFALLFTGIISSLISKMVYAITSGETLLEGTLYYTIVFASIVLLTYIASIFLYKTSKKLKIAWLDRTLGAILGGVKSILIMGLLLNLYAGIYKFANKTEPNHPECVTYKPILKGTSVIMDFVGDLGFDFDTDK